MQSRFAGCFRHLPRSLREFRSSWVSPVLIARRTFRFHPAPAAGGPSSRLLTPEQKAVDREARLMISRELGQEREQVTAIY